MSSRRKNSSRAKHKAVPESVPASSQKIDKPSKVSKVTLGRLRKTAKTVRKQVAKDADQIAAEAREIIASAIAEGKLIRGVRADREKSTLTRSVVSGHLNQISFFQPAEPGIDERAGGQEGGHGG
jgi:hypothetical protein